MVKYLHDMYKKSIEDSYNRLIETMETETYDTELMIKLVKIELNYLLDTCYTYGKNLEE